MPAIWELGGLSALVGKDNNERPNSASPSYFGLSGALVVGFPQGQAGKWRPMDTFEQNCEFLRQFSTIKWTNVLSKPCAAIAYDGKLSPSDVWRQNTEFRAVLLRIFRSAMSFYFYVYDRGDRKISGVKFPRFFSPPPLP